MRIMHQSFNKDEDVLVLRISTNNLELSTEEALSIAVLMKHFRETSIIVHPVLALEYDSKHFESIMKKQLICYQSVLQDVINNKTSLQIAIISKNKQKDLKKKLIQSLYTIKKSDSTEFIKQSLSLNQLILTYANQGQIPMIDQDEGIGPEFVAKVREKGEKQDEKLQKTFKMHIDQEKKHLLKEKILVYQQQFSKNFQNVGLNISIEDIYDIELLLRIFSSQDEDVQEKSTEFFNQISISFKQNIVSFFKTQDKIQSENQRLALNNAILIVKMLLIFHKSISYKNYEAKQLEMMVFMLEFLQTIEKFTLNLISQKSKKSSDLDSTDKITNKIDEDTSQQNDFNSSIEPSVLVTQKINYSEQYLEQQRDALIFKSGQKELDEEDVQIKKLDISNSQKSTCDSKLSDDLFSKKLGQIEQEISDLSLKIFSQEEFETIQEYLQKQDQRKLVGYHSGAENYQIVQNAMFPMIIGQEDQEDFKKHTPDESLFKAEPNNQILQSPDKFKNETIIEKQISQESSQQLPPSLQPQAPINVGLVAYDDQIEEEKLEISLQSKYRINKIGISKSQGKLLEKDFILNKQEQILRQATIPTIQEFQLRHILDILDLQDQPLRRKLTPLYSICGKSPSKRNLKDYMSQFKTFADDVLGQGEEESLPIDRLQNNWLLHSNELLIDLTLAMVDRMPADSYHPQVTQEILKLEKIGEAFMENQFLICSITDPHSYNLMFNDIENWKIQTMKYTNINDQAYMFDLSKKIITNQKIQGGRQRDLYQIAQSMVGAVALWAGIEPALHLLQMLKIVKKKKTVVQVDPVEEENKQQIEVSDKDAQIEYEFNSREEEEQNLSSESDRKFFSPPKDQMLTAQVRQYFEKIKANREFLGLLKTIPQSEQIEQSVAELLSSDQTSILEPHLKVIYSLPFIDSSFIESKKQIEIEKSSQFLQSNFTNLKLKTIGSSHINLMYKTQTYIEGINNARKAPAQNIDEAIVDIMSPSWQSFCLFNSFNNKEKPDQKESVPLVISENNEALKIQTQKYEVLFKQTLSHQQFEMRVIEGISQASTKYSSKQSLSSFQHSDTNSMFMSVKDSSFQVLPHLFDPKASEQMFEIAESFVPEYSTILNAIVGATYVASNCNLEETSRMANYLLQQNNNGKFPVFQDQKDFYCKYWLEKKYSRTLKLHFTVDQTKLPDHLYYKAYIQTLEIRRVKFKPSHSNRCKKFFQDLKSYVEVSNLLFEFNQGMSNKPLSPYEYILFHQAFRKVYKINMTLDQAKNVMPFDQTNKQQQNQLQEEKKQESQENPLFEKRASEFANRILKSKTSQVKKDDTPMMTQILEIIANNIDTDIKSGQLKAIQDKTQNNSQKQIDIMFYIENAISSYALIRQKNREKNNQQQTNILLSLNEELQSVIANKSKLFRGDIDLSSQSVVARDLFTSFATVDECFDVLEETEKLQYPPKFK